MFGPGGSSDTPAVYETTLKVGFRNPLRKPAALSLTFGAAGFAVYHRGERVAHRRVEVLERVDERAVEIEHHEPRHGAPHSSTIRNSTRRFFARPRAVSFEAIGRSNPYPAATSRSCATPLPTR